MAIIQIENEKHWHDLRRNHIGASEIAALFGDKAFTTKHEIWTRMRGLYSATHTHDFLEFGQDMEPIIAKYLARTYSMEVMKSHEYHECVEYPWLGATLDYYILDAEDGPALLQIKHVSGDWVKDWSQVRAPFYIEMQVQQELFVTNSARKALGFSEFNRTYIGAMIGGNVDDLRLMERRQDWTVVEDIIDRSTEFMNHLEHGDEPPLDNPRDIEHIRAMFIESTIDHETLDLRDQSTKVEADIVLYEALKDEEHAAARRAKAVQARLMRSCMVMDKEDVIGHLTAETDNYLMTMNKHEVHRRAREESVSEQLKFGVRKKK